MMLRRDITISPSAEGGRRLYHLLWCFLSGISRFARGQTSI